MAIALPPLPFAPNALEPHLSRETLELHHGKHHRTYVDKVNRLLAERPGLAELPLEEILLQAQGALFDNAAQAWNHDFFWKCLTPEEPPVPESLRLALERHFGDEDRFEKLFTEKAIAVFGSGWAWLVRDAESRLEIVTTANGDNPLLDGRTPLLTCDVWEHAYYLDYRNDREQYLQHFWRIVNWEFVASNLAVAPRPARHGAERGSSPYAH
ncbi:MAG TPA: superoxide dismutase [Candidatus Binatia bacterium]|nr:superoxide dismutase [Candidatus Binatia bacterium]